MSDKTTKRGVPTRDFTDAGTEESFAKGKAQDFEQGVYDNYFAAGLVKPEPGAKGRPRRQARRVIPRALRGPAGPSGSPQE